MFIRFFTVLSSGNEGKNMKTAAVVVTYNRLTLLQQNMEALRAQTVPCDIMVIDNASSDGTERALRPDVEAGALRYFNTGTNIGGSGGFNLGIRKAIESGYDYVWIMDDDCIPDPNALEELLRAEAVLGGPEKYGFLSSTVLWKDGTDCVMNRQKRVKAAADPGELSDVGIFPISQATFVSLLFPRLTVLRYGLPVKDFFIWGDDIEYTRRIAVRGCQPSYLVDRSRVTHLTANNVGSNIGLDSPERIDRYYYAFRNEAYLHRQEGVKGRVLYIGKRCRDVLRILFLAGSHRRKRFRVLWKGVRDGLRFRPVVEYVDPEVIE